MINNYIGKTVGIFTIVERMPYKDKDGHAFYKGVCDECGFERIARIHDLKATAECTHIRLDGEVAYKKTYWKNRRINMIFNGMKQRCYNEENKSYRWYGAKGIKVYKEWMDNPLLFEEWSLKNGYDDDLTIDRIDENKDYSPDNCRWITKTENSKSTSSCIILDVNGERHTCSDWSRTLGLGKNLVSRYVRKYGINNTVEFIKRYINNPNLEKHRRKDSIYSLYMN